nr:O-antigen ligase family protein [Halomarina oriensis]
MFGISYATGLFPGGFIGTSRSLLAVLFLLAPVTAVVLSDKYTGTARWWLLILLPTTLVLLLADTASGLGAFLLLLVLVGGYGLFARATPLGPSGSLVATGVSVLGGLLLLNFRRFSEDQAETSSADTPPDESSVGQTPPGEATDGRETPSPTEPTGGQGTTPSPTESTGGQETTTPPIGSGVSELLLSFVVENLGIRVWLAFTALEVALQYPLFGLGGGNFQLLTRELGLEFGLTAHNTYLSVLVEFGLPGFVLFMSAVGYTYYATLRLALEQRTDREMWMMVLAGLLTFHAFNFWVSLYHGSTVYAIFWAFAAAIAGEYAATCEPSPRFRRIRERIGALR